VTNARLVATILHSLFDIGKLRLVPGLPQEILRLTEAKPIEELF
jgi:hypothetical protein